MTEATAHYPASMRGLLYSSTILRFSARFDGCGLEREVRQCTGERVMEKPAVITAEIEEMKARRTNGTNGDHEKP